MTLAAAQSTLAAAIMTPLGRNGRAARNAAVAAAARLIKPNGRLTGRERLDIYCRSYWFRLLDSFRDDFPGLAAILGPARFERLARAYLAACPSRSYTLRDLGSCLEAWLRDHKEYAGARHEPALDMVRIEWAHVVAFDGPSAGVPGTPDLNRITPALRLGLQPYITLLHLHYPVDELRVRTTARQQRHAPASNTTTRTARRARLATRQPVPTEIYVAVHRVDLCVYYRRLGPEEYRLLCALRDGQTIAAAIRSAFTGSAIAGDDILALLETWFTAWAAFGWLTTRTQK
jgi:hypothetical protein